MRRIRPHLTYSNVMSTIAVFAVLAGGSAWAASKIDTNQIKKGAVTARKIHHGAVTTKKIKDDAVTGAKAEEASFGQVPDAARADNATNLDGKPASDYRLHCPDNLDRAGDLCYEVNKRPAAHYEEALKACALDQRRLPNEGELALVFDHLGAPQDAQWVAGHWRENNSTFTAFLEENSSRQMIPGGTKGLNAAFRCVTSATN
jgi:hypothetical protein